MTPYKFVSLDPPWAFATYSKKGMTRSAENHYPCLDIVAQRSLAEDLLSVMDKDSVMFMWVTSPFLKIGLELMETYGYKFKTSGVWVKVADGGKLMIGTGYHMRAAHELFLVGTRGKGCCPAQGTQKPSVFTSTWEDVSLIEPEDYFQARTQHSRKPDECWEYGELYTGPYLELYARRQRPGWTCLGNQWDGRDIRESLQDLALWMANGYTDEQVAKYLDYYRNQYLQTQP